MSRFQEKAQALTKKTVGQMIGDDKLVHEGIEQERHAEEQQVEEQKSQTSDDAKAGKQDR